MIDLTDSAASAIRNAISSSQTPARGLRIMVEAGGCAGYKYMMGLVEEPQPGDILVERLGVNVFVDPQSAELLSGTTVDFVVSMDGAGFAFKNPNASSNCSCGKSFG